MPFRVGNFHKLRQIGDGTYGAIYRACHIKTGEYKALKKLYMDDVEEGIPSTTIREISIIKQLCHPNIVVLEDLFFAGNDLYLVLQLAPCDLKQCLNEKAKLKQLPLSLDVIRHIMYQIVDGISYCHALSVVHRDMKPQNILVDASKNYEIKITDFGLSRCYIVPNKTWTHEIITLWYRPPEVLLGCKAYSLYVDVWSVGCIFGELCNNNKPLFRGDSEIAQLMHIFRKCGTPNFQQNGWQNVSAECKDFDVKYPKWPRKPATSLCARKDMLESQGLDLMDRMLYLQPNTRISAKKAMKHPFFSQHK
eukprot:CAMPEP_0202694692 /NCGR_PEP_ID=MMETSP1385-20130828/8486_1 /ASSEMBLY_ACC=CAM_ASM_000861 /TAXON_ID=933848 /ORGANISM="Elphidium margaritaceum" /LENGTH=306 /DNA_ID=CAMNT_0049350585 /DNA_START=110 /DNA_END=1030 /DNA_ORIENTATION=+